MLQVVADQPRQRRALARQLHCSIHGRNCEAAVTVSLAVENNQGGQFRVDPSAGLPISNLTNLLMIGRRMIRLSRLADYGVVLMSAVAADCRGMHTAQAVAEATGLPLPTVSKLLSAFARAGLLKAVRGAKGGYCLSRRPEAISVAEIIGAVDGPIALTQCIEHGPGHCDVEYLCQSRRGFRIINDAVRNAFEAVTLADLIEPPLVPLSAARLAAIGGQGMAR